MPLPFVPDPLRRGPFTTARANGLGVSSSALRRSPWRHLFRDVWMHVVADALAHAGLITPGAFTAYVRSHRKLRGVRQADAVCALIEPLSESPMESRLRVLLVNSGFEAPVAQYVVRNGRGDFVARADLAYPEQRIIVEYDGAHHWDQRREDDRRRDAMRALGWTVLVASRSDYYDHPQAFIAQLRRAFAAAA